MSQWTEWNGGPMPVDCDEVFYRLRHSPDRVLGPTRPDLLRWDHGRTPTSASDPALRRSDIVAYRVVPARPLEVRE